MKVCGSFSWTLLLFGTFLAGASTSPAQTPASRGSNSTLSIEKIRDRDSATMLQPRAPVVGQPFDDREVELYIEAEARKLWAAGRVQTLQFGRRSCPLDLPVATPGKLAGPALAARAEAATLVLGEFSRDSKRTEAAFNIAGGAFVIAPSGICLTSLHVTRDKNSRGFCAMTRDGRVYPIREVLAYDSVHDLAIVQLALPEGVVLPALPLAREAAAIGTPVFVMSHPDDRFFLLSTGHVARHTLWRTKNGAEAFMTITADFAKGSSGCPVLDESGAVIGIVNNTESIYFDDDGNKTQTDLQMVVKNATPSWAVRGMISVPPTTAGKASAPQTP
jgi:S1-C subfamily serine protease